MKKNRDDILLFALVLLVIEFFYYSYCMTNADFHLYSWMMETLSNRFIVMLIQGMAVNIMAYRVLESLTENPYRVLRYGNGKTLIMEAEKGLVKLSLRVILIFLMVVFAVALAGEGTGAMHLRLDEFKIIASLEINIFLFQLVLGNVLLFFLIFGIKGKIAAFLAMGLLFCNYAVSNNILYAENPLTKLTWAGNVLIASEESYSIHFLYWILWILVILVCCLLRMYIAWDKLYAKAYTKYSNLIVVGVGSFLIFTLLGFIGKQYMTISGTDIAGNLMQYFYGFKKLDVFVFLYLLYQLPIWIMSYLFLEQRMNTFFVQYLLRGKSMVRCLTRLVAGTISVIGLYYAVGVGTLAVWSRNAAGGAGGISADAGMVALQVFNLFLQSVMLIMLAFEIGLWMEEQKHTGAVITIILHLILAIVSQNYPGAAAWIPLSGGVYCTHIGCQPASCMAQLVYLFLLLAAIGRTIVFRCENIIMK